MLTVRILAALAVTGGMAFFAGVRYGAHEMRHRQLRALTDELLGLTDELLGLDAELRALTDELLGLDADQ